MYLFNSLKRKKELFVPLINKKVLLYVCGITPYDTTHLGHAFLYVFFDAIVRYLRFRNYSVIYTQNVTDVDDDILKKAREEKKNWRKLGDFWTRKYLKDMKDLNVARPDNFVKATDSIAVIVKIIENLMEKKIAYQIKGNVYFEVSKFKRYGELSRLKEQQMLLLAKERGGNPDDPLKKHPLDFILWQKSLADEPHWESPWGSGRSGWHIECSAMNYQFLGGRIDIHGGGRDLVFPHHESEIAQSESFTGKKPFVKYWLHTSMVMHEGEKMSKSLGNLVMVSDLRKTYSSNAIRYLLLSHHYRSPWEFQREELDEAEKNSETMRRKMRPGDIDEKSLGTFMSLLDNDMDTRSALSYLLKNPHKKLLSALGFVF